jgi:hypothetical protein
MTWLIAHRYLAFSLWIVIAMPLAIVLLGRIGGWRTLAARYATTRPMPPGSFLLGTGDFGKLARYRNLLRAGSDAEGVYLRFWPRLAHPPIFVPWPEIAVEPPRRVLFEMQSLVFGPKSPEPIRFTGFSGDIRRLLENPATTWRPPPPKPR